MVSRVGTQQTQHREVVAELECWLHGISTGATWGQRGDLGTEHPRTRATAGTWPACHGSRVVWLQLRAEGRGGQAERRLGSTLTTPWPQAN